MENKPTKHEHNHEKVWKSIIHVIRKYQKEANNNETAHWKEPTYSYISINQW